MNKNLNTLCGLYFLFLTELSKEERSRNVKQMLREKLPIENYELFKYLIEFLVKVCSKIEFLKFLIEEILFAGDGVQGSEQNDAL